MSTHHDNPVKSSRAKTNEHTSSGYSLFQYLFDLTKSKLDYYRGMKKFCKDIKQYTTEIINYEKKEIIPLTYGDNKSYEKQEVCYICKKEFNTDKNDKNALKQSHKVRDHCHYTGK